MADAAACLASTSCRGVNAGQGHFALDPPYGGRRASRGCSRHLLCGDEHRADDLVQESVTKLYLRWRNAREADNLDRYVRAIMVRTHIDDTRRPWFRVRLFGTIPEQRAGESTDTESATALRSALSRLPAGQRAGFLYTA